MDLLLTILSWVGIVVGGVIGIVIIYFLGVMVWIAICGGTPEGAEVDVQCPVLLPVDEAFAINVVVRNLLDRPRTVRSLDFSNSFMKGVLIERIEPTCKESSASFGTTAHTYDLAITPRGSTTITLHCRAAHAGEYSGDVFVYIDSSHTKSISKTIRVVIR